MNPLLSKESEKFLSQILVAKGVALHAEQCAMRMLCSLELEVPAGEERVPYCYNSEHVSSSQLTVKFFSKNVV